MEFTISAIKHEIELTKFDREKFVFKTTQGNIFKLSDFDSMYVYVFDIRKVYQKKDLRDILKLYKRYSDSILFVNFTEYKETDELPGYYHKYENKKNWVNLLISPPGETFLTKDTAGFWGGYNNNRPHLSNYVTKRFSYDMLTVFPTFFNEYSSSYIIAPGGEVYYPYCFNYWEHHPKDVFEEVFGK